MRNVRIRRGRTPPPNVPITLPPLPPDASHRWNGSARQAHNFIMGVSPQKKIRSKISHRVGDPTGTSSKQNQPLMSSTPDGRPTLEQTYTGPGETTPDHHPGSFPGEFETNNCTDASFGPFSSMNAEEAPVVILDHYDSFCEAVMAEAIPFLQLADDLYIVTGWDSRLGRRTNHWYHLQVDYSGGTPGPVCYCPMGREQRNCVHERYLKDEGSLLTFISNGAVPSIILFWRDAVEEGWINLFSVGAEANGISLAKQRVVVTYMGPDTGFGHWKCSREGTVHCSHIVRCQTYLQQMVTGDPTASAVHHRHVSEPLDRVLKQSQPKSTFLPSVSHQPIMAPEWARIPSDAVLYTNPPPVDQVSGLITLDCNSRCCCGTRYVPEGEVFERTCTVYTIVQPISTRIQLQRCPHCSSLRYPSRAIGPDCRDRGIFNYNNSLLFSHDLLEDYTSSYTSAEIPFAAWVKIIGRRYQRWSGLGQPAFVDESVFRTVWFAYVGLLDLANDMICPLCGPTPEAVIWDGVTLAYNKKHVLDTIYPPTSKHADAIIRPYGYPKHQSFIDDPGLRKLLISVVTDPLILHEDAISGSIDMVEAAIQKLRDLDQALTLMTENCSGLRTLLIEYYGSLSLTQQVNIPREVTRFFMQICTNESVTQVVNRPALRVLEAFINCPSPQSHASLACIPCVYHLGRQQWSNQGYYSLGLIEAFTWVRDRVRKVLNKSIVYESPVCIEAVSGVDGGWEKSGCKYSMPQIRHRPQYPRIIQDVSKEPKERGGLCNKYYSEYGESKLTGGIMVAWCRHSISYGFHFIPESEGRNDVFSAMVTRWPVAPKYVIYDFACQLAPYCRAREADFFADTTFLIDDFHAMGHSKCSSAFFLKTYAEIQPSLGVINSSAAECGNGGLSKIRKSIRYMGQGRAIQYTGVFLSIWNRIKIRKVHANSDTRGNI